MEGHLVVCPNSRLECSLYPHHSPVRVVFPWLVMEDALLSFPLPWVRTLLPGLLELLSTWALIPFSGFFHKPSWTILNSLHLVLFLALRWAVSHSLSSAKLRLPLESRCRSLLSAVLFPVPPSCPDSQTSLPWLSLLSAFLTFLISSSSTFHVPSESVETRSPFGNPVTLVLPFAVCAYFSNIKAIYIQL